MKRFYAVLLVLSVLLMLCACGASKADEPEGSYTYTFDGMMGEETMQLDFSDGKVAMSLPGNTMITDQYESDYTVNEDGSIAITGFTNTNADSPYPTPGLWDWINAETGACCVILDYEAGTFAPAAADGASDMSADSLSDIRYASNSEAQVLDLLLPEGDGPFPLVVLVHGGGFKFGDKQMSIVQKMFSLTDAGYAVATINYRLSDEASFPAAVADVKAAVRFLRANAAAYDLDPDRFALWGESAGAYLAAMTAFSDDDALIGDVTDNSEVSSRVCALLDFYGPASFSLMQSDAQALGFTIATDAADSFESAFLGKAVGDLSDAEKSECDVLNYVDAGRPIAVFIRAGDADTDVPYTQSQRLADACAAAFGADKVNFSIISGAAHMDDAFYTSENLGAVIDFLNESL